MPGGRAPHRVGKIPGDYGVHYGPTRYNPRPKFYRPARASLGDTKLFELSEFLHKIGWAHTNCTEQYIGLPRRVRDWLSDLVNDKDKDLEIRGEAALILSLCGYTNSRLTEQLKKIISKVAEDSLGKEVSRPIVTSDLSGHCFVITTSSGIDKVTYPKSFIILVAALYNIYENCNRSDLMRNLLTQYKLTRLKGEIQDLIETFMPLKLEGYAKKHLKPINK